MIRHYRTFLTGEADPAVQAAAAAVASVALRPVATLAGLCAVGPEAILSTLCHETQIDKV